MLSTGAWPPTYAILRVTFYVRSLYVKISGSNARQREAITPWFQKRANRNGLCIPSSSRMNDVRGFLGTIEITQRGIRNYSELACSLVRVTGKVS